MKELSLDGKLKIQFQDSPPGAVPAAADAPPSPPDVKKEVLDVVRNILGRRQDDNAVRLEDGMGRLGRRFEGEFRHIHQRLDQHDDQILDQQND